jgi:uncharacterized membrane protein
MKGKNTVYKLILTAVFAALTIVGCLIQIPLPSGGMVHLGNLVIIIAALLCGGLVGGLAGGIGGFLYDLLFYSSIDGALKYLVLKFVMGFVVGSTFRLFMKKDNKRGSILLGVIGGLMVVLTTLVLLLSLNGYIVFSSKIENVKLYLIIVSILGYILGLTLIVSSILSSKFNNLVKNAMLAISLSVVINIVLELIAKLFLSILLDSLVFEAAFVKGISTMPSCILTGALTLYLGTLIFPSLHKATRNFNLLSDDTNI